MDYSWSYFLSLFYLKDSKQRKKEIISILGLAPNVKAHTLIIRFRTFMVIKDLGVSPRRNSEQWLLTRRSGVNKINLTGIKIISDDEGSQAKTNGSNGFRCHMVCHASTLLD